MLWFGNTDTWKNKTTLRFVPPPFLLHYPCIFYDVYVFLLRSVIILIAPLNGTFAIRPSRHTVYLLRSSPTYTLQLQIRVGNILHITRVHCLSASSRDN